MSGQLDSWAGRKWSFDITPRQRQYAARHVGHTLSEFHKLQCGFQFFANLTSG